MDDSNGHYIMLISVHGLIRGADLELGRDADTGGQTKYVVELARALIQHPEVSRVDLVTRLVSDPRVDPSYAAPIEELAPGANIVRIRCGPARYLKKESLWPHLDGLVDNTLQYLRTQNRSPDLLHGHYADAGHVAMRLSSVLDVPMLFTGHSLGRVKRQRLLDHGSSAASIERRYRISRRIEAEERALEHAALVIASTHQEIEEQYALYDHYEQGRMLVCPPGVDLSRFSPPPASWDRAPAILAELQRFLRDWRKPMILAVARPDPRKNLAALVRAYGEHPRLRDLANLVVVAGTRDDLRNMSKGTRRVLVDLLRLIDYYDLYGHVAYPKYHAAHDVPELYRLAASTRGVFVNSALTEPFGLTLIEAAASGLPIIAPEDGGPRDILAHCENGHLIDPLDHTALGETIHATLTNAANWDACAANGIRGAHEHFSWKAHADKYMRVGRVLMNQSEQRRAYRSGPRLVTADRLLVTDIDNTLTGDRKALDEFVHQVVGVGERLLFGIATGRNVELTLAVLEEWGIPIPQLLITSVGSEIHYGPHLVEDRGWSRHISYRWNPQALHKAMAQIRGVELQGPEGQANFKISYDVDPDRLPPLRDIQRHLRRAGAPANLVYSHGAYLDLLPIRASKGMALRYIANKWRIPLDRCLVAGDSGNDEEMLTGNTLAVVVGNYSEELETLRGQPRIYFAQGHHARGILEGIEHYNFLGHIRWPALEGEIHESFVERLPEDAPGYGLSVPPPPRRPGQAVPTTL